MEALMAICVGIGLSAACGFRVFVPLLGLSLAANAGHLQLAEPFEWIGTPVALGIFGVATALEIGSYYIPWLDNMLDTIATPAAIVAGAMTTGAMATDMSPVLQWGLAAIVGGGSAGAVQAASVVVRGASSATTGGLGNPIVSTGELAASTATTVVALLIPALAIVAVLLIGFFTVRWLLKRNQAPAAVPPGSSQVPPPPGIE